MCLWCGYQISASVPESEPVKEESRKYPDSAGLNEASAPIKPDEEELPEWRQELSQRLHSIKQKRESAEDLAPPQTKSTPVAEPEPTRFSAVQPESGQPAVHSQDIQDPQNSQSTRELIDDRTYKKALDLSDATQTAEHFVPSAPLLGRAEDWITLLSRVLSGLVDLIIMLLSAGFLVLAADIFSGVRILGITSVLIYSSLLLLVYFLYTLFFLGITNQTIGMMMTNLRLAMDKGDERPQFVPILIRSVAYLLSVACLGAGLIWALFDRERRCFHDRLTNTRVVRA
jgi:uncharacterized RDD family membrane protein YckC